MTYDTQGRRIIGSQSTWEGECKALRAEIETLTKSGIIEVAVRNPNVMEYMRHWEGRAEKAEARVAELEAALTWYRDQHRITGKITIDATWAAARLTADGGARADAALQQQESGE